MARPEPPTNWALPTATQQMSTDFRVAIPLRLHPKDSSTPSLWLATQNPTGLIRAAWAHEQENGGKAEVITSVDGVVIRSIQPPLVPFYPVGDVQAFAGVESCAGLFLPVGMGLRPAIRAAMWQELRVTKSIQLFDGKRWLVIPLQAFRSLADIVEVLSPVLPEQAMVWIRPQDTTEEAGLIGSHVSNAESHAIRPSPEKAKAGFTQHFRQLFTPKTKAEEVKKHAMPQQRNTISSGSRTSIREDLAHLLLCRANLTRDNEIEVWNELAKAYSDVDEQQASLARSHATWLMNELSQSDLGKGVRAEWLAALVETKRRGGDSLYLATAYDRLLHQIDDGLDRVHDLPAFLWPKANDPVEGLIELHRLFVEHGPSRGVAGVLAGLLFASAALNCHEPRLATTWLTEARTTLKELPPNTTTQSVLMLCDAVQRGLRIRTIEQEEVVEPACPKIAALTRRCQSFKSYYQRLKQDDPEWLLLGGDIKFASAKQLLQEAEQERTAAVLPRNVLRLGAAGLCRTSEEVVSWVALVPDAIELQAEFWRTRWPGETQLFDVQVRWCERLMRWTFDGLRQHKLDATEFLRQLFAQARERETPLRLALANGEWHVARCLKELGKPSVQKSWLALGLHSTPSALLLRGKTREAIKILDELAHQLAEAPLETIATERVASSMYTAFSHLPDSQALERGRSMMRIIGQRVTEQGDDDVFAWKILVTLDGLLSTLFASPPRRNDELLAWVAEDEQRIRKRMAHDLAQVMAAVN